MKKIEITTKSNHYVLTFEDAQSRIRSIGCQKKLFWIIDLKVFRAYNDLFASISSSNLFLFDVNETNKSLEMLAKIVAKMEAAKCNRKTEIIAVGGGITLDVAGFVASIFMRGIQWISVPTTLLSAADSCLGGKTAVNFMETKNLLGTIYPPKSIWVDVNFWETLDGADRKNGLAEILKMAAISGKDAFQNFEKDLHLLLSGDKVVTQQHVYSSLLAKKNRVVSDEFEQGSRMFLNFGHTYGHAIEVLSNYEISHGKAVALGILLANNRYLNEGLISQDNVQRMKRCIEQIFGETQPLLQAYSPEKLKPIMLKDKKVENDCLRFILINDDFLPFIMKG